MGLVYKVNQKVWFNKEIMLDWVKLVLAPYIATASEGILPILFFDLFKVHMMQSVVKTIQALDVQVEFIPTGCTWLVQPVEVGNNKAFKVKMREQFNNWTMAQDPDQVICIAMCHKLCQWIIDAQKNVNMAMIHNAWKKTGYLYYPAHPCE